MHSALHQHFAPFARRTRNPRGGTRFSGKRRYCRHRGRIDRILTRRLEKKTAVKDYSGECHIEFTGNKPESGPPKSPLKYKLQINKPGKYTLAIRARKRLETGRADISTDCFVALKGDQVSILVNGKRYDIPVASLSQADQEFIHDWQP